MRSIAIGLIASGTEENHERRTETSLPEVRFTASRSYWEHGSLQCVFPRLQRNQESGFTIRHLEKSRLFTALKRSTAKSAHRSRISFGTEQNLNPLNVVLFPEKLVRMTCEKCGSGLTQIANEARCQVCGFQKPLVVVLGCGGSSPLVPDKRYLEGSHHVDAATRDEAIRQEEKYGR